MVFSEVGKRWHWVSSRDSLFVFQQFMICLGVAVFEFSYLEFVELLEYVDYSDDPGKMYKLLERH